MDLTDDKSEEIIMAGNIKNQRIKQGQIQLKQINQRKIEVKKDLNHRRINLIQKI